VLLHEKRGTANYSTRSYDEMHSVYHGAVVLLVRLFDADDAEAFRRNLALPSLASLSGSTPAHDREIEVDDSYDKMLGQAILQLELRQAAIRDEWPDNVRPSFG
jgi:hypothetical protein